MDNYQIQAQQAKRRFLGYDQVRMIEKLRLKYDETYLYTVLFSSEHRISRSTGHISRLEDGRWVSADSHAEVLTLLDLVCDSRADRHPAFRWRSMADFGLRFHQDLSDTGADRRALAFQRDPEGLRRALETLGGRPIPQGDVAYAVKIFEDLELAVQFWDGDEDFPPKIRYLWDENALMYLKYETMYYAVGLLLRRIDCLMAGR